MSKFNISTIFKSLIAGSCLLSLSTIVHAFETEHEPFIEDDSLILDIVCSQSFITDKITNLLATKGGTLKSMPNKVKHGLEQYNAKLMRNNSETAIKLINKDRMLRIIKANNNQALLFDKNHKLIDELNVLKTDSSNRKSRSELEMGTLLSGRRGGFTEMRKKSARRSIVRKNITIVSQKFSSNLNETMLVSLHVNHNQGPHLLITRYIENEETPEYSTQAYACVETRL